MTSRDRILDAAADVMRTHGLANTTTKAIAKAAGLSEAMLYKLFRDKVDIFLGVLTERLPQITVLSEGPTEPARHGGASSRLRRLVGEIAAFYLESFPIAASVFSDPSLLTRHREALYERGAGPHQVVAGVAALLATEQRAGRIGPRVQPEAMAELLVGACFHRAFLIRFAGESATASQIENFAEGVVSALEPALFDSKVHERGRARSTLDRTKFSPG